MIIINYLYIGIDDTDSPDGMCTTYLACDIIRKLKENNIDIVDYPRLIRLNPFARFKTRGNGGVSFKIINNEILPSKDEVCGMCIALQLDISETIKLFN